MARTHPESANDLLAVAKLCEHIGRRLFKKALESADALRVNAAAARRGSLLRRDSLVRGAGVSGPGGVAASAEGRTSVLCATLLEARDPENTRLLDTLIVTEQKRLMMHPAVQKYLNHVWTGAVPLRSYSTILAAKSERQLMDEQFIN